MREEDVREIVLSIINKYDIPIQTEKQHLSDKILLTFDVDDQSMLVDFRKKNWFIHPYVSEQSLENASGVLIDKINQNDLIQAALGLSMERKSKIISTALMNDQKVYLRLDSNFERQLFGRTNPYIEQIKSYYKNLKEFKVIFLKHQNKSQQRMNFEGELLKELHVNEFIGEEIVVNTSTKITPLAIDAARRKQIKINRLKEGEEV